MKALLTMLILFQFCTYSHAEIASSLSVEGKVLPNELTEAIEQVAEDLFEWHQKDEKQAWLRDMLGRANRLSYTSCLAGQIRAIGQARSKLFEWQDKEDGMEWAKSAIQNVLTTPNYDCDIPDKIEDIIQRKDRLYEWHQKEEGLEWARREVAALL